MTEGIAYQAKDILFKSLTELYKDSALKVFHLDDFPKPITLLNNEFPRVTADEKRSDTLFLLEDDSLLMLEYESNSRFVKNHLKYLEYAHRILYRYYSEEKKIKKIRVVVVYTSDVTEKEYKLDAGDVQLSSKPVFLCKFGGNHVFYQIKNKIENGEQLLPEEIFKLSILPLMDTSESRQEMIEKCFNLAKKMPVEDEQLQAIAGILTATDKFIDEGYAQKIREWIKMTKVGRIIEEEKERLRVETRAESIGNTLRVLTLFQQGKNIEQIADELKLSNDVVKEIVTTIRNNPN